MQNSGVAIGSSVGHAIGGFFGGGSSAPTAAEPQQNAVAAQGNQQDQSNWGQRSCETDAKQFTKCLDDNQGNMQICGWYLEQLVSYPELLLFGITLTQILYLESLSIRRQPVLKKCHLPNRIGRAYNSITQHLAGTRSL